MTRENYLKISAVLMLAAAFPACAVFAGTDTVEEAGPKYRFTTRPSAALFMKEKESRDLLVANAVAGYIQGVDSNPYLDSTHKADNYSQELVDMNFRYPVSRGSVGSTDIRFGYDMNNVTYYKATDVSIMDNIVDVSLDQQVFDNISMSNGYELEILWYPNDENGTFVGNKVFSRIKHRISDGINQSLGWNIQFKNYLQRKVLSANGDKGSNLRYDVKNVLEHEISAVATKTTKIKVRNEVQFNTSNFEYINYYDYFAYRIGGSITQIFTRKFYSVTNLSYQRKNYSGRICSDKSQEEMDNLYILSTTFMYDLTKSVSLFANYSHTENHTNEPLQRYTDNLFTAGVYYSF